MKAFVFLMPPQRVAEEYGKKRACDAGCRREKGEREGCRELKPVLPHCRKGRDAVSNVKNPNRFWLFLD